MDAVTVGLLTGAGAIFTGVLAPSVLYLNGKVDRRARKDAEERAERAEQQKADLEGLRVLVQEQRAELDRVHRDSDELRVRNEVLASDLATERRDRRLAEDQWHRLQARYPDD